MRLAAIAVLGILATPALAQDGGNVGQPSRMAPQTGQTTGGTLSTAPGAGGAPSRPAGEMGMSPGAGAVESAKGGNADQTNKPVPNSGNTSGGPSR